MAAGPGERRGRRECEGAAGEGGPGLRASRGEVQEQLLCVDAPSVAAGDARVAGGEVCVAGGGAGADQELDQRPRLAAVCRQIPGEPAGEEERGGKRYSVVRGDGVCHGLDRVLPGTRKPLDVQEVCVGESRLGDAGRRCA